MEKVKLYKFNRSLNEDELDSKLINSLQIASFSTDWFGNCSFKIDSPGQMSPQVLDINSLAPSYCLAVDSSYFYIIGIFSKSSFLKFSEHTLPSKIDPIFQEGLWKDDLLEVFFKSTQNNSYLEFHLNPAGKFWIGKFESYRTQVLLSQTEKSFLDRVKITSYVLDKNSCLLLKIPLELLEGTLSGVFEDLEKVSLSICSIIYRTEPLYFSTHYLQLAKPDFHKLPMKSNIETESVKI